VVQTEERALAYVVMHGYTPDLAAMNSELVIALVTFRYVVQSRFGYPNDEVYTVLFGGVGTGIFEVIDSDWKSELKTTDEEIFGPTNWFDPRELPPVRHFFIGSKDASFSALARDIDVELVSDRTYGDVIMEVAGRLR
jgi:hypothetical protein